MRSGDSASQLAMATPCAAAWPPATAIVHALLAQSRWRHHLALVQPNKCWLEAELTHDI